MSRHHFSVVAICCGAVLAGQAAASSHMDAPKITLDDAANTTDVYAFVSADSNGRQYLTTALAVYPFEEPGIGPNAYRFDDQVRYSIHVALDGSIAKGEPDLTFEFDFSTVIPKQDTVLQSYLGLVGADGSNRNLRQAYRVTKVDRRLPKSTTLGEGAADGLITPPNNQGLVTPLYNQGDNGDAPAKEGVSSLAALDPYTSAAIKRLPGGYYVFAGQRDDGFYADIQSIFDLDFSFGADAGAPTKPFDSQGGFNVHTIVLSIPLDELRETPRGVRAAPPPPKIAGVYATTARRRENGRPNYSRESFGGGAGLYEQIGRQGNPLFVEALLPISEKDRYNESEPRTDSALTRFADDPELSRILGASPLIPGLLRSIFIPDLIKVDLTTGPARLAGQSGFNRLSVFGGDVLKSEVQDPFKNGGFIPGGWPNGRRFGDDVVDIAIIALGLAGAGPDFSGVNADRVTGNDITYNQVFPYAATPLNGRAHGHH
jgi:hypothetical protein